MTQKSLTDFSESEPVHTSGGTTDNPVQKYTEMAPEYNRRTAYTDAPPGDDEWFCPWCGSRNIVASPFDIHLWACADCEAPQPVKADWYPDLIW